MTRARGHAIGHAIHEYALGIGLVAVLAILALNFLGFSVSDLMAGNNDKTVTGADKLYQMIGTNAGGTTSGGSTGGKAVSVQVDPKTGKVTFMSANGSNVNTTSVDGMKGMANGLEELATQTQVNGQPLPNDVQAMLKELSSMGESMADLVAYYENARPGLDQLNGVIEQQMANGQYTGQPMYPQEAILNSMAMTETMARFQDVYNKLQGRLGSDPALANLKQKVDGYAAGISNTAFNNMGEPVMGNVHIDRVDLQTAIAAAQKYPDTAGKLVSLMNQASGMSPAEKDAFVRQHATRLNQSTVVGTIPPGGMMLSLK